MMGRTARILRATTIKVHVERMDRIQYVEVGRVVVLLLKEDFSKDPGIVE